MSRASNTANLGAKLQNTTGNELSGGGNIRAVTFQGSGRLLTDLFTTTGGNILIPFGPGSNYPNLEAALNSISAFVFDDTASVILQATNGIQTFSSDLFIDHPYSDKITLSGSWSPFQTTFAVNFSASDTPVTGVSGGKTTATASVSASTLSASFIYNPAFGVPSVGTYLLIGGVSGRHAEYLNGGPYDTVNLNGRMTFVYQMDSGYAVAAAMLDTRGTKILVNKFTNTGQISSAVFTVSGSQAVTPPYYGARWVVCEEPYDVNFSIQGDTTVCVANPHAYRGTTFTQSGLTLTFSDAAATNTYLNPGDMIFALGQAVTVDTVGGTNTCTILEQFLCNATPPASGTTTSITIPRPFFIKTHFEKYRGCHRVYAVNTGINECSIETPVEMFAGGSQFPNPYGIAYPMPRYGIHSIGAPTSFPSAATSSLTPTDRSPNTAGGYGWHNYPQGRILRSVLNISNVSVYVNGSFNSFQNLLFYSAPTGSKNFTFGNNAPSTVNMSNCGFYGIGAPISSAYYGNNQTYGLAFSVLTNSVLRAYNVGFSIREMTAVFRDCNLYYTTFHGNARTEFYNTLIYFITKYNGGTFALFSGCDVYAFIIGGTAGGYGYIDGTVSFALGTSNSATYGVIYGQSSFGYNCTANRGSGFSFSNNHSSQNGLYTNQDMQVSYCTFTNQSARGFLTYAGNYPIMTNNTFINCNNGIAVAAGGTNYTANTYGFGRGGAVGGLFALNATGFYVDSISGGNFTLYNVFFRNNTAALNFTNSNSVGLVARLLSTDQSFNTTFVGGGLVAGATTGFTSAPATGNLLSIS